MTGVDFGSFAFQACCRLNVIRTIDCLEGVIDLSPNPSPSRRGGLISISARVNFTVLIEASWLDIFNFIYGEIVMGHSDSLN